MSNHMKEPWEIVDSEMPNEYLVYAEGETLHLAEFHGSWAVERAKRAVACVNALAGINPEAVGEIMRIFKDIHHILRLDRGDYKGAGSQEMFTIDALYDHFDNMEAAIALAEKEE